MSKRNKLQIIPGKRIRIARILVSLLAPFIMAWAPYARAAVPAAPVPASALPQGGSYQQGAGKIIYSGSAVNVNTTAAPGTVAVINWGGGFNVGSGYTANFNNGTGAPVLNAVNIDKTGSISNIAGAVNGTGPGMNIIVVNPNGVTVGAGARIDTTGAFGAFAGDLKPSKVSSGGAGSVNVVLNNGLVMIDKSAAANSNAAGKLVVGPSAAVAMSASGTASLPSVIGSSDIAISGADAKLTGSGAVASGGVSARIVAEGDISLSNAQVAASKQVDISATNVSVAASQITASDAGGRIRLGGDWHGKASDLPNAQTVSVDKDSALKTGLMGGVTVWSDQYTQFAGTIVSPGGNAEVSGKVLDYSGFADLRDGNGRAGTLTLDPLNICVGGLCDRLAPMVVDSSLTEAALTAALMGANVNLVADNSISFYGANILAAAGSGGLKLDAGGQINLIDSRIKIGGDFEANFNINNLPTAAGTSNFLLKNSAVAAGGSIMIRNQGTQAPGDFNSEYLSDPAAITYSGFGQGQGNILFSAGGDITVQAGSITLDGVDLIASGAGNVRLQAGQDVAITAHTNSQSWFSGVTGLEPAYIENNITYEGYPTFLLGWGGVISTANGGTSIEAGRDIVAHMSTRGGPVIESAAGSGVAGTVSLYAERDIDIKGSIISSAWDSGNAGQVAIRARGGNISLDGAVWAASYAADGATPGSSGRISVYATNGTVTLKDGSQLSTGWANAGLSPAVGAQSGNVDVYAQNFIQNATYSWNNSQLLSSAGTWYVDGAAMGAAAATAAGYEGAAIVASGRAAVMGVQGLALNGVGAWNGISASSMTGDVAAGYLKGPGQVFLDTAGSGGVGNAGITGPSNIGSLLVNAGGIAYDTGVASIFGDATFIGGGVNLVNTTTIAGGIWATGVATATLPGDVAVFGANTMNGPLVVNAAGSARVEQSSGNPGVSVTAGGLATLIDVTSYAGVVNASAATVDATRVGGNNGFDLTATGDLTAVDLYSDAFNWAGGASSLNAGGSVSWTQNHAVRDFGYGGPVTGVNGDVNIVAGGPVSLTGNLWKSTSGITSSVANSELNGALNITSQSTISMSNFNVRSDVTLNAVGNIDYSSFRSGQQSLSTYAVSGTLTANSSGTVSIHSDIPATYDEATLFTPDQHVVLGGLFASGDLGIAATRINDNGGASQLWSSAGAVVIDQYQGGFLNTYALQDITATYLGARDGVMLFANGNVSLSNPDATLAASLHPVVYGGLNIYAGGDIHIGTPGSSAAWLAAAGAVGGVLGGQGNLTDAEFVTGGIKAVAGGNIVVDSTISAAGTPGGWSGQLDLGTAFFQAGQSGVGGITLGSGSALTAVAGGDALTLVSGQSFTNLAGSSALSVDPALGGRWLVYSADPSLDTRGQAYDFKLYNCQYGGAAGSCGNVGSPAMPATGKGFVYSVAPVLNVQGDSGTKIYGQADPALGFSVSSGLIDGDTVGQTLQGNVARVAGETVAGGPYSVDIGTLASQMGYGINYTSGVFMITPKAIAGAGPISADNKVYDGNTAAALNTSGALSGVIGADAVTLQATGTFSDKNAGAGKTVFISGASLVGADASNYALVGPVQSTATADITAKAISATGILAADKVYDGNTSATINAASAILAGVVAGDVVSVSTGSATGVFVDMNAGVAKTVTISGLTLSGADAANYSMGAGSVAAAAITPKSVSVSGIAAADKTYDGTTSASVSTAGAVFAGVVSGDTLAASATGVFSDKNAGIGKTVNLSNLAISGADSTNYVLAASGNQATATASISAKTISVSGITANDKVYDGNTSATVNTGAAAISGLVAGDNLTVSASGTFGDKNVGVGKTVSLAGLSISGADASNYALAASGNQSTTTASITGKTLTVSGGVTASDKVYEGTTAATLNASGSALVGLVAGDSLSIAATGSFQDKNASAGKTVDITGFSVNGADAGNYILAASGNQATATASITPKAITAAGIAAADKVYDGTVAATVNTGAAAISGLVAGDNLSIAAGSTGAFADKNAGVGKTVSISGLALAGADAGNYSIGSTASTTANIAAKAISVSGITANDKVYDGNTSATVNAGAATVAGLVAGDSLSVSASGSFGDKNVGVGKTVTLAGLSISGADAGNYALADSGNQSTTTASITGKTLTVSGGVTASDKVYDGTTAATLNASGSALVGMVAGDNLSISATGSFQDKNAAAGKTVDITSLSVNGVDSGNYILAASGNQASTTAAITPKAITASGIAAADKVYDGATTASVLAGGATFNGMVAGDNLAIAAGSTGAFADKNAGLGKSVSISGIALAGSDAGNYTIASTASATANISAKTVNVSGITANDKVYDGTVAATVNTGAAAISGLVAGDNLAVSAAGSFGDKNVGVGKTVSLTGLSISGADAGNYTLAASGNQSTATASITGKTLTVSGGVTASDKVYDGTTAATLNASGSALVGLVAGDSLSITAAGSFQDKNAAAGKTVDITGFSVNGADAGNYILAASGNQASTTATITPKAITAAGIAAADKVYDGTTTASVLTGGTTFNGMVAGDNLAIAAGSTGAFADKNAGSGKAVSISGLTLAGADAGNYSIASTASTTANITAKSVNVSGIAANDKVYDGTLAATVNTGAAVISGLVAGDNLSVSASGSFGDKNVGVGKTVSLTGLSISGADAGNYTLAASGNQSTTTASITGKTLTVSGGVVANDKVYDGTVFASLNASGSTLVGLVAGDSLSISATGSFQDKNAALGKSVDITSFAINGADAGNYVIAGSGNQAAATASITPKSAAVSGLAVADKIYDGTVAATIEASGAFISGIVSGDSVAMSGTATGAFADKNAGSGKSVSISGVSLTGADASNYAVSSTAATTASISAKTISVSGITANDKVYDGNTSATVYTGAASIAGLVAGDSLSVSASGSFGDKNVGVGKTVSLAGLSISGADAGNYALAGSGNQSTATASITGKTLTVSGGITAAGKTYDGNTSAVVDASGAILSGMVAGDALTVSATGSFQDKNAGLGKTVDLSGLAVNGADAGNYILSGSGNQATTTASIAAKAIGVSGIVAADKVYDGSVVASIDASSASFSGIVAGDNLSIASGASGSFSDKNAGNSKVVSIGGVALAGADAGNYSIASTASTTANITAKSVNVSGITANDKVYDGNTAATVNTGAAAISGLVSGDRLSVSASGSFGDKNVGVGKTVSLAGLSISGADASNYALAATGNQSTTTASITGKSLTVSGGITAAGKTYDGNTSAVVDASGAILSGMVAGDALTVSATGAFLDKNAGSGKAVSLGGVSISGADSGNYILSGVGNQTLAVANIAPKAVSITGVSAIDKTFDGTTATGTNYSGAAINGLVGADAVAVAHNGLSNFADPTVGNGKAAMTTGLSLTGADTANYVLGSSSIASLANITPAPAPTPTPTPTPTPAPTDPVAVLAAAGVGSQNIITIQTSDQVEDVTLRSNQLVLPRAQGSEAGSVKLDLPATIADDKKFKKDGQ